jgi:hypothetical protein
MWPFDEPMAWIVFLLGVLATWLFGNGDKP